MLKQNHFDSRIYISIRWIAFIIASLVSALLNIFLFSSLDASYTWLLISMSICLEGTKVSTIMTRNCFASIYEKIRIPAIKAKQHLFMTFYLLLAILSVTAGLGFSITITARTEAIQSTNMATLQAQRDSIQNKINEIDELALIERITLYEYPEYVATNTKYQDAETDATAKNTEYRTAIANRNLIGDTTSDQYAEAQRKVNAANQLLIAANEALTRARTDRTRVETVFNERKTDSATARTQLNEELRLLISQANLQAELGSVALIELDNLIKEENNRHIIERGMGYMFEEFAKYLHTTPELVKLWILLFVAILIELTIYQTSPDIRISRRVLYFFRNNLPHDVDVKEILQKFDDENKQFEDMEEKIIEQPTKDKVQTLIDKPVELGIKPTVKKKRKYNKKPKPIKMEVIEERVTPEDIKSAKMVDSIVAAIPIETIQKLQPELAPVQEQIVEQKVEEAEDNKSVHYRFGRAVAKVRKSFEKFVKSCIADIGPFIRNPDDVAGEMRLNQRAKTVFLERLSALRLGNTPLIIKNKDDTYTANFDVNTILNYATEEVEED